MDALARPVVPPAPYVHKGELSTPRLVIETLKNTLGNWSEMAFDNFVGRRKVIGIDSLLVSDPEGVRHVLHANFQNYRRPIPTVRPIRPMTGDGLLLAEGEAWRRQRRMLAPAFTPASVNLLIPHFHAAVEGLMRRLEAGSRVNLSAAFHDTALDAVLRALFSLPADETRAGLAEAVRDYLRRPGRVNILDGLAQHEDAFGLFQTSRRAFQKRWFKAVDAVIAARKAQPAGETHRDLLDLLLAVRDPASGAPLTDEEVRNQCATLLVAGFETTSRLLFWTAWLLALDPLEQARLRRETVEADPESLATLDDLHRWPRLRQVLCEALRLYPPVPLLMRQAIGEDTVCGERIGPGVQVWMAPWVMHRHRLLWDQPTAFVPDRFAGKPQPWVSEPGFIPFGAGPRICIGATFAMAEASVILATLLSRFEWSLDDRRTILPVGGVTISPNVEPWFRISRIA